MEPVIDWSRLPEAYRTILEPLVKEWIWILPVWVQYVTVQHYDEPLEDGTEEYSADTDGKEHYRMAKIRIRPTILKAPINIIEQLVVHELLHVAQSTYDRVVDEALESIGSKPERKFFTNQLIKAREAMTEDIAWCLIRRKYALDRTIHINDGV